MHDFRRRFEAEVQFCSLELGVNPRVPSPVALSVITLTRSIAVQVTIKPPRSLR